MDTPDAAAPANGATGPESAAREIAELQARIDKARAAKLAIELRAESRTTLEKQRADAEREEREAKEAAVLDEFEAQGEVVRKTIYAVRTPGGLVVVKRVPRMLYNQWIDGVSKRKNSTPTDQDLNELVRPQLLYPDKGAFNALLDEYPHALRQCADAVIWLAGARKGELAGE